MPIIGFFQIFEKITACIFAIKAGSIFGDVFFNEIIAFSIKSRLK